MSSRCHVASWERGSLRRVVVRYLSLHDMRGADGDIGLAVVRTDLRFEDVLQALGQIGVEQQTGNLDSPPDPFRSLKLGLHVLESRRENPHLPRQVEWSRRVLLERFHHLSQRFWSDPVRPDMLVLQVLQEPIRKGPLR